MTLETEGVGDAGGVGSVGPVAVGTPLGDLGDGDGRRPDPVAQGDIGVPTLQKPVPLRTLRGLRTPRPTPLPKDLFRPEPDSYSSTSLKSTRLPFPLSEL